VFPQQQQLSRDPPVRTGLRAQRPSAFDSVGPAAPQQAFAFLLSRPALSSVVPLACFISAIHATSLLRHPPLSAPEGFPLQAGLLALLFRCCHPWLPSTRLNRHHDEPSADDHQFGQEAPAGPSRDSTRPVILA
jgi:hypothetical protein